MNIEDAERKIAALLRDLECDTGQIVDSVQLTDIDVTTLSGERQRIERMVRIKLIRLPATQWGQADILSQSAKEPMK